MIIDNDGEVTIVFQDNAALPRFLEDFGATHHKLKNDNLIVNLLSMKGVTAAELSGFLKISRNHREGKRSFVIVTDKVSFDQLPEELLVVPTLQEARDLIEMEEIERDLGL